jgi:hypothetical protein
MPNAKLPIALRAADCAPRTRPSVSPAAIVACIEAQLGGRERRPLGEPFGLTRLGINLTCLAPDAICALRTPMRCRTNSSTCCRARRRW